MEQETKNLPADADIGTQKRPIIAILVAALILIALLAPCILAAASSTIYPRTTVAGISVGGMTRTETQAILERELAAAYETAALPITVSGGDGETVTVQLPLSALNLQTDVSESAAAAWTNGREDANFFTGGIAYAKGLLFGHAVAPAIALDEGSLRAQIDLLADQADIPTTECAWRIDGSTMYITKPKSGFCIDREALCAQAKDAISRYDLRPLSCTLQKAEPAAVTMAEIYEDARGEAKNAYYDKESGTVKEGKSCVAFDAAEAQQLMDSAAEGTEFAIPVTVVRPEITREEMEEALFRDELGSCTTSVSGTANRKHNVSRAVQSCNGIVLNPGDVFSYNATLGERTAANGYRAAGAYLNGKTVQEFGGGICQVSSTLYYAVLRSDLEIVERRNHTFWPGYITLGMDATVSWGGPDFKFRNNTDYPIRIEATYANGRTTCAIRGTNVSGNSVKMEYRELSSTPYSVIEKADPTLPAGTQKELQNGYTGRKVVSYRCVYDASGALVSRTLEATSLYSARDKIVLVGPSAQTPEPEVDTTPPESGEEPGATDEITAGSGEGTAGTETGGGTQSDPGAEAQPPSGAEDSAADTGDDGAAA